MGIDFKVLKNIGPYMGSPKTGYQTSDVGNKATLIPSFSLPGILQTRSLEGVGCSAGFAGMVFDKRNPLSPIVASTPPAPVSGLRYV